MVSSTNILLGALVAAVLGFIFLKKNGTNFIPNAPEPIVTENPQIKILNDAIKGVQGFINTAFKTPILTKGLTTGGKTFPCRGPNCLGIFQARGTVSGFDPFTGQRVALGGSTQFQNITGLNLSQFGLNQQRITQGGVLLSEAQGIIKDLQGQLSILETKSV